MDAITKELQKNLLEMLVWFHEYCEHHHLRYYVVDGTMLGAVRHEGFIPWDDDIDIGMPRVDYEKLIKNIGDRKCEKFYLETPFSRDYDYRYPYSKLYNTKTTLIEHAWPNIKRGIFIDVFPLDGLGDSKEESFRIWKKIVRLSNFEWARICGVRKDRAIYKNIAVVLAHCVPDVIARDKEKLKKMDELCKKHDFDNVRYGGSVFSDWGFREIVETSIIGKPTLYSFEGVKVYGVQDYNSYLTSLYGDWKKLPPTEKQVSHHDFVKLDLKRAYMR